MADNVYEGMVILNANRYGRDPEAMAGQVPDMVKEAGGEILVSRLWEERRLAYPIKGQRKGTYWLTYFRLDSEKLAAIQHKCRLEDTILRALFLKVDPRIVDALVAHATGVQATEEDSKKEDGEVAAAEAAPEAAAEEKPAEVAEATPTEATPSEE